MTMQTLSKTALNTIRQSQRATTRAFRRYAHEEHGGHASAAEPLGRGFWGTVAVIPAGYVLYLVSRSSSDNTQPFLTRVIDKYTEAQDSWARKNDLHVRMIEQAGEDRVLFMMSKPREHVEMSYPEIMNVGSPWNVPAGSQVQLTEVIDKYRKLANEENERKLQALQNNEIRSEQPFDKPRIRKAPDMYS